MRKLWAGAAVIAAVMMVAVPAGAKTYKPGQTATTSDFKVTVYGITDPWIPTNQFDTPDPGKHYAAVDVQIKNPTGEQKLFSSLSGLHIIDSANRQYDVALGGCIGLDPRAPDGQIPSKLAIRGFALLEIPDGSTKLKARIQGSFTAEGSLFQLTDKAGVPIPPKA